MPDPAAQWRPLPPPPPKEPSPLVGLIIIGLVIVSLLSGLVLRARLGDDRPGDVVARNPSPAPTQTTPSIVPTSVPSGFGSDAIGRIALILQRLRGLTFKSGVSTEVLTATQLQDRVRSEFGKDQPRKEIDISDKVLTTFGLLRPEDDLYALLLKLHTEQVAGYYDSDTKKLVVGGDASKLTPYQRVLTAHELTHALTDQYFGLSSLDTLQDQDKDDEATAFLSLVEGDATAMMLRYGQEALTRGEQTELQREASAQTSDELDAAPAVLRRSLIFPYEAGRDFALFLLERGGTAALDAAYRDPPQSTEQIMHPQRYVNRDNPQEVTVPDVRSALGSEWTVIDRGGVGELDVDIIADQFLPQSDAEAAAEGWDGGKYVALESSAGTLVAMTTVWDDVDEAREFAELMTRWMRSRFEADGSPYREGAAVGWESESGSAEVLRNGTSVVMIIGPSKQAVSKARGAF